MSARGDGARKPAVTVGVGTEKRAMPSRLIVDGGDRSELSACVTTFRKWLHLPDCGALYVTLATVAANRGAGDPVWLLLVGPPGGGKTETLVPISHLDYVYQAATMTEASLLSGTPKREKAPGAKGGLLREIGAFGIIVLKDFGSVLSMNRDARAAVLAALREIYDGSWTRHVGTDGGRTMSWSGKVGLIAGCTPAIDSHHVVMSLMGERFLVYRLPTTDAEAQARSAISHVGREAEMRAALANAVARVLGNVDEGKLVLPLDGPARDRLISLSTLAVRCRSAVERDGYSREVQLIPEPEAPARLTLVLLRLFNGLRAIGVEEDESWRLVTKCALDSMPALRRRVLDELSLRTVMTTLDLATAIGYPPTTTRRTLEDLTAHGIVARGGDNQGKAELWSVATFTRDRWPTAHGVPE